MTASLVFRQPAATSGRLVFGVDDGGSSGPVIPPVDLTLDGYFPDVEFACELEYRSDTQRPLVSSLQAEWQEAAHAPAGTAARMRDARKYPQGWQALWCKAISAALPLHMRQPRVLQPDRRGTTVVFQIAQPLHAAGRVDSQSGLALHVWHWDAYAVAALDRLQAVFRQQDGLQDRRPEHTGRNQAAHPWQVGLGTDFQEAVPNPVFWDARFQPATQPLVGISIPGGGPVIPPKEPPCYTPDPHLVFTEGRVINGHLVFMCGVRTPPGPGETIAVPVKEVYLTINSALLTRLDNGQIIPATAMNMSLNVDSWTWSFSASVPGAALAAVQHNSSGDPVIAQATINGTTFRFLLERIGRERSFNSAQLRISGRGLAAELDAPYAALQSFGNSQVRTARQLLDDILTINGAPLPWQIDQFAATDWLVPANVFSHQGSYISAINAVVGSIGGYVQPHNTDRKLNVLLRYPQAPWNWGSVTPDFELPSAVATQEGFEWVAKANYNRVFVSGQNAGVLGQVTRTGTAGDLLAPMVTDPLITHADAARQRGIAELSDTGRIAMVTLRLPVLADTGIIKPGKFVHYKEGGNTHVGMTRSVTLDVNLPTIYQTLTVETHLEPV